MPPVTRWLATVDDSTQQVMLLWTPSADSQTMGYHICTGTPCLDYDTVFGRFDTSYICVDHPATEAHTYRIHVFDSAYNVSSLTPSFGNMVLTADVPECYTTVTAQWTPYRGMPGGLGQYRLLARIEPFQDDYYPIYTTDSAGPCRYQFDIAEGTTRVWLKVQAFASGSHGGASLVSQSNIVSVERRTVDTAAYLRIDTVVYDSIDTRILLAFSVDTAYHTNHYVLWRSVDGTPWDSIAAITDATFADVTINPYDSLHCYQLSVVDACGMNERYSDTRCIVVPDPLPPAVAIPNAIMTGDPDNGTFRPRLQGLKGNLYELYIYNRTGLLVHSTTDVSEGWTPTADTPQGVYTYVLTVRFNNNQVKVYYGAVTVLK